VTTYALSHLSDSTLLRDLAALVARDRVTTAALLAHLAEVDTRKLYLPAAYPSMYAYCVGELRMSEDAAYKRIRTARTAREYPAIFATLADGRLNLSSVLLLTPYLTPDTADALLAAAAHQTNTEIERLLAERFPRTDVPTRVQAMAATTCTDQLAARPVDGLTEPLGPGWMETPVPQPRVAPLAPERFALQVTIGQGTHDKLRYAQALLGHAVPSGDVAAVLDRALDALIGTLERHKFAARSHSTPRRQHGAPAGRYVPAHVRRAVWQRDGGQCTFVSEAGHRCPARTRLEFDHLHEVARGGQATVTGIRLRCRAHNQFEAERTFGTEFMRHQRIAAAEARSIAKAHAAAVRAQAAAAEQAPERDVAPWLRQLGFRADEVRLAAARCAATPDASLEERVRLAVSSLARGGLRRTIPGVISPA
jgi:5-methylcytosine-specific restriction endonuclease McrA